jgi:hypothetical protein
VQHDRLPGTRLPSARPAHAGACAIAPHDEQHVAWPAAASSPRGSAVALSAPLRRRTTSSMRLAALSRGTSLAVMRLAALSRGTSLAVPVPSRRPHDEQHRQGGLSVFTFSPR